MHHGPRKKNIVGLNQETSKNTHKAAATMLSSSSSSGNRSREFRQLCAATTVGIPLDEYVQLERRRSAKRRKANDGGAAAAASGSGSAPVALNFLGDLGGGSTVAAGTKTKTKTPTQTQSQTAAAARPSDPWMDNARRLDQSIAQMSSVLVRQEEAYVDIYGSIRTVYSGSGAEDGDENAMTDADRDALDAAVASFAVSTGNQIESLRSALPSSDDAAAAAASPAANNSNAAAHRVGIVGCLLSSLRSDVLDRMAQMHAVRTRQSLRFARDPLRCDVSGALLRGAAAAAAGGGGMHVDGLEEEQEEEEAGMAVEHIMRQIYSAATAAMSVPLAAAAAELPPWAETSKAEETSRAEEEEFRMAYGQEGEDELLAAVREPSPAFPSGGERIAMPPAREGGNILNVDNAAASNSSPLPGQDGTESTEEERGPVPELRQRLPTSAISADVQPPRIGASASASTGAAIAVDQATQEYYGESTAEQEAYIEDLRQESAYLTASLQNELEDVHKVERKMTEVTTLLRQFGDLVSDQQEDIVAIHDQAERSKKNVEDGQNRLVDAGERKKQSKHYMATFIVCMGLLLLFFNWITP